MIDILTRVGYGEKDEFEGAEFHLETDPIKVISAILERETVTLTTGEKEIKFLNIITDHTNAGFKA